MIYDFFSSNFGIIVKFPFFIMFSGPQRKDDLNVGNIQPGVCSYSKVQGISKMSIVSSDLRNPFFDVVRVCVML